MIKAEKGCHFRDKDDIIMYCMKEVEAIEKWAKNQPQENFSRDKNRYNSTFDKTFVDAKEAERVNANLSEIIAENVL